jgi:hypothetical protein
MRYYVYSSSFGGTPKSDQYMFVPVYIDEQLVPGTIEFTIAYIVDNHLDLSLIRPLYHNDKTGAAAYSLGTMSSRRIEKTGASNVNFMCLSGDE